MFIDNKYTKWYYQIIHSSKIKDRMKGKGIYYEKHHIIPKCGPFCGSDEPVNLVLLTPREHFLCHWLLTKMCCDGGKWKMQFALHRMLGNENNKKVSKNLFSKKHFEIAKKHQLEATYARAELYGFPMEGKKHSEESKKKMRLAKLGVKRDPEKIGYLKTRKMTTDTKQKISKSLIGRSVSEDTREKLRKSNVGKKQKKRKAICVICGQKNYLTQIKRYHNDNCKHIESG